MSPPGTLSIAVTGNIASGKSAVCRYLGTLGANVIDADTVAQGLMRRGQPAWQPVVDAFGPDILDAGGEISRPALRQIVFAEPAALLRLNAAVHPLVHALLLQSVRDVQRGQVVVIEAVAIVEAGTYKQMDQLWLVLSSRADQISRLMVSRHLTREEAAFRVDAQTPAEAKVKLADVVLRNQGSLDDLHSQASRAWRAALAQFGIPNQDGRLLR